MPDDSVRRDLLRAVLPADAEPEHPDRPDAAAADAEHPGRGPAAEYLGQSASIGIQHPVSADPVVLAVSVRPLPVQADTKAHPVLSEREAAERLASWGEAAVPSGLPVEEGCPRAVRTAQVAPEPPGKAEAALDWPEPAKQALVFALPVPEKREWESDSAEL